MSVPLGGVSLRRIAMTSLISFAVSATSAFFLAPFIVKSLGNARYGALALVAEIGGYYGMLDFGFRAAIAYLVATKLSRREESELPSLLSSAFWVLALLGLIVLVLGASVTVLMPTLFRRLHDVSVIEAQKTMAVVTLMLALQLPLELFTAIVNGCRRLDLAQGVDAILRIVTSVGIWMALSAGGGMVAVASIQLAGRVTGWSANFFFARTLLGSIPIRLKNVSRQALRSVWDYGSKSFVTNLAMMVIGRVDLIVIGATLNLSLITFYTIGRMLVDYMTQVVNMLSGSFTMHMTDLHGRANQAGVHALYTKGTRLAALLSLPMSACIALFGAAFIRLWQGSQFVTGPWTARSDIVLYIWILAQLPRWMQGMSWQLMLATYRVKALMWIEIGEAAVNLTLSLILVRLYGIAGVAIGTLIPAVIVHGVLLPAYVSKNLHVSLPQLIRESYARPAIVAVLCAITGYVSITLIGLETWRDFATAAAVTAVVGALSAFRLGLTPSERQEVIDRLRRFRAVLAPAGPNEN
jgi:O-antigen/teichoic acid export membrane protein